MTMELIVLVSYSEVGKFNVLNIDLNECGTNNGGCNQTCINDVGSYHCACINGYTLDEDGRECSGKHVFI